MTLSLEFKSHIYTFRYKVTPFYSLLFNKMAINLHFFTLQHGKNEFVSVKKLRKTNSELVEINSLIIFPKAQIVFPKSDMLFDLSVMDNNKKYPRLCESRIFMRMEPRILLNQPFVFCGNHALCVSHD